MFSYLRQVFDLRFGESRIVIRSAVTLFGLIAAHTMLETARDALFLGRLPVSRLSLVYALLAVLSFFVARANASFVRAFGRRNGLITTLLGAAFGTIVFYLLKPSPTVVFALYVWSGLLGSVLVVQFWMLVGQAYTVSQGKRLFGLLASGGVLGAIAGAFVAMAVLDYVEVTELLVVAASIFLATAMFLTGEDVDDAPLTVVEHEDPSSHRHTLSGSLGMFADYPYLLRLSVLVALSTAAVLTTDYVFKAVAAATHTPNELGAFFAQYYAALNSAALVVQVFVASVLIQRGGVIGAFMLLPTLLVVGGGVSLLIGGGLAIFATKGADGALRHSLHRISSELLWMPLPEHVRARAKGIVDTVIVRVAQAVVASVLIVLSALSFDSPRYLAALVVVLSGGWLMLAIGLRKPYLDLFRAALNQRAGLEGRLELDLRSVEVVVEALSSRTPSSAIAAMELLEGSGRTRLIPALILYHESEEVLIRALQVVPIRERVDWVPLAERLLEHEHAQVRVAAVEALAQTGHTNQVQRRLEDISPWVRAHAAFWLVEPSLENPEDDESIRLVLDMEGTTGREARVGLLEAIEASGDDRWANLLLKLADSHEKLIAQAAVKAMTRIQDVRFIPILIRRLAIRDGRPTVREAIVGFGGNAFSTLKEVLYAKETNHRIRVHIPGTIARFRNSEALEVLTEALENLQDGRIRYKTLRALVFLSQRTLMPLKPVVLEKRLIAELREVFRLTAMLDRLAPLLSSSSENSPPSGKLLLQLLEEKRLQARERVFLLLQAGFPTEDLRSVQTAAHSGHRRRMAQAQEFLDALTLNCRTPELRPLLRIMVDDLSDHEVVFRAQAFSNFEVPRTSNQALRTLLQENDGSLSGLSAYYAVETGRNDLRAEVLEATRDNPQREASQSFFRRLSLEEAQGLA